MGHPTKGLGTGVFWQKRYYDVRSEREFKKKLRYIHRNPVKRELVAEPGEWKWSSFRHYAYREIGMAGWPGSSFLLMGSWVPRSLRFLQGAGVGKDQAAGLRRRIFRTPVSLIRTSPGSPYM